jgi:hypothetical protein
MNKVCRHSGESTSMDESRIIKLDDLLDSGQAGMTDKSNQVYLECMSSILWGKLKSLL